MWIVETDDPTEIEALIKADPFWPTGLRKSYSIIPWTQVFANGKRLIKP
ncbi:YciI family protein [Yoonia sp. 2307UL14-13]